MKPRAYINPEGGVCYGIPPQPDLRAETTDDLILLKNGLEATRYRNPWKFGEESKQLLADVRAELEKREELEQ